MQRCRQQFLVRSLVLLEGLVVFKLVHTHVGGLDRLDGEEVQHVALAFLDSHGE